MMTIIVMIRSFHFCRHVLTKNKLAKEGCAISMINLEIFREYDIRGIADQDLTSPVVEALGRTFAEYLKSFSVNTVTVGFDVRLSSSRLCDDMVRGLTAEGMQVIILGLCPTPALYFSLFHLEPGAGVMITGSHNPAEFNGFKLCVGKDTIYGEEIQKLRYMMTANEGRVKLALEKSKAGGFSRRPILPDYIEYLRNQFSTGRQPHLNVVLDAGNGTAGLAAPQLIRAMGCEVFELFSEPDGKFPNHHPDPTIPKNLTSLIAAVRSRKADVGIAFDGDSDRIGVVDEQGNILWGDQLMVIFSRDILHNHAGATFVSEVKCSQVMYDDIRAHGGNAVMWKTGHSLIKAKMKELSAAMAGEMSGHLFFADRYFGYDDAIYAACRLVEILKKFKSLKGEVAALSSMLADLPTTFTTPEIRFDCPDAIKFRVVETAREFFSRGEGLPERPKEVITVDGVRAVFDKGWGLIRASNTQPVLVMRFEAQDAVALDEIRKTMEHQVNVIISGMI
jgi:phosphomannomutase / phosphoglucomutase